MLQLFAFIATDQIGTEGLYCRNSNLCEGCAVHRQSSNTVLRDV